MKTTAWIVTALVFAGVAYVMGPDLARYMKMRSM